MKFRLFQLFSDSWLRDFTVLQKKKNTKFSFQTIYRLIYFIILEKIYVYMDEFICWSDHTLTWETLHKTSSFTRYKFLHLKNNLTTIVNGLSVMMLFQLSIGD